MLRVRSGVVSLLLVLILFVPSVCQESPTPDLSYANRNQVDYGPLKIGTIQGRVIDTSGVPIPQALVILFTDPEHKVISHTYTTEDGRFEIRSVKRARYRLMVKYDSLCPANMPLQMTRTAHSERELIIHMEFVKLDGCSWGEVKQR